MPGGLQVRFDPPAHLQRRSRIYADLRRHAPRSLLDIGCGEGAFLSHLLTCDDQVPISALHGFDIDEATIRDIQLHPGEESERWRPLQVSVLHGGIQQLGPPLLESYDAVAAIEVLEHLDPPDVQALGLVLRRLAPRVFYVTTPNRDFNAVFERIGSPVKYRRPGIPYAMRHDDHRFEMSRMEFQDWAHGVMAGLPYKVSFHGIGSVENAFAGQDWHAQLGEHTVNEFGCSTQLALFERVGELVPEHTASLNKMYAVKMLDLPFNSNDGFPPTRTALQELVVQAASYLAPLREEQSRPDGLDHVSVGMPQLYESNYAIQRICRFSYASFATAIEPLTGETWQVNTGQLQEISVEKDSILCLFRSHNSSSEPEPEPGPCMDTDDLVSSWLDDTKFEHDDWQS